MLSMPASSTNSARRAAERRRSEQRGGLGGWRGAQRWLLSAVSECDRDSLQDWQGGATCRSVKSVTRRSHFRAMRKMRFAVPPYLPQVVSGHGELDSCIANMIGNARIELAAREAFVVENERYRKVISPVTRRDVRRVVRVRARNDRSLGLDERARSHCDGPWPHLQHRRARVQWVMCRRVSSRCRRRHS